jgi:hypothetical protein
MLMPYEHGLELRLEIDREMRTTRLCRDRDECTRLHIEWRQMVEAKGWKEEPANPTGT